MPPGPTHPKGEAAAVPAPSASLKSQKSGLEYAKQLFGYAVIFGFIGILFGSWFPPALGAFLFFTDNDFIDWALQRIGIGLTPNSIGAQFVRSFVFLAGLGALIANWKDSLPAWLLPWLPFGMSWPVTAAMAAGVAVFSLFSAWVTKHLLASVGIERPTRTLTIAIDGVMVLTLLALVFVAPMVLAWFGFH